MDSADKIVADSLEYLESAVLKGLVPGVGEVSDFRVKISKIGLLQIQLVSRGGWFIFDSFYEGFKKHILTKHRNFPMSIFDFEVKTESHVETYPGWFADKEKLQDEHNMIYLKTRVIQSFLFG